MLSLNNHITVVNGVFCKCVWIVFNWWETAFHWFVCASADWNDIKVHSYIYIYIKIKTHMYVFIYTRTYTLMCLLLCRSVWDLVNIVTFYSVSCEISELSGLYLTGCSCFSSLSFQLFPFFVLVSFSGISSVNSTQPFTRAFLFMRQCRAYSAWMICIGLDMKSEYLACHYPYTLHILYTASQTINNT